MKVHELIRFLQTQPQNLDVAYELHSENKLLEYEEISVERLCEARPDGWVPNYRKDKPSQEYLLFPGN